MNAALIVAIDGPSGVGKSTVGRLLASRLGLPYLDTGAMYRAVGLRARREGVALPITDPDRVAAIADAAEVRVTGSHEDARTFLDGEDVSFEIRTPEISMYASAVSAIPRVRRRLAGMQRELALSGGGVLEGRDIATHVVPETPFKFFLSARPEVRAARRHKELLAKGTPQPLESVLAEMEARDAADSSRADSPLVKTPGHLEVDTSEMSIGEVVAALERRVLAGPSSG